VEAGARIPRHRHAQIEELFVLSADLQVENQVMFAGD
jgi:anti-sigma factor ChrR (cupin superfamily)